MMVTTTTNQTPFEIIDRFVVALSTNDVNAMQACCSPTFAHWYNTTNREMTLDEMLADNERRAHRGTDFTMTSRRRHEFKGGVVTEVTYAWNSPTGPIRAHACAITTIDSNGRIDRINEYVDGTFVQTK